MRRGIIAGVIVTAGLATAGVAYAGNQPADPSVAVVKAAASGAATPDAAGGKAGLLKGAIHGDLLVRGQDGTTHTVTFDRGKVSSISSGSITIERPDGVSVTDGLNDQTVFNGTARDKLTAGTPAIVVADGHTATHVVTKGARAQAVAKACGPADGSSVGAGTPAAGAAAGAANPADGSAAAAGKNGKGLRARIKERVCQRLEQRQQRRAGKGLPGLKGRGRAAGLGGKSPAGSGQGAGSGSGPAAGPSSMVDDGSETIVS